MLRFVLLIFTTILVVKIAKTSNRREETVSVMFMTNDEIFELLIKYPDAFVIMGGDFYACMSRNDSLNRLKTKLGSHLTDVIKANNRTSEIMDVYRSVESEEGYTGYTWNKLQC